MPTDSNENAIEAPPSPDHASLVPAQSAPSVVSPKAVPRAPGEPDVRSPADIESKGEPPRQKKVAQRSRETQTAMFDGNPFTGFFSW